MQRNRILVGSILSWCLEFFIKSFGFDASHILLTSVKENPKLLFHGYICKHRGFINLYCVVLTLGESDAFLIEDDTPSLSK